MIEFETEVVVVADDRVDGLGTERQAAKRALHMHSGSSSDIWGHRGKWQWGVNVKPIISLGGYFETLLGLPQPAADRVEIRRQRRCEIEVEWPADTRCAVGCGQRCGVYDHAGGRWWRHLVRWVIRPGCAAKFRAALSGHGVRTVDVPWRRAVRSSRWSLRPARWIAAAAAANAQARLFDGLAAGSSGSKRPQWAGAWNAGGTEEIRRVGLDEKSFGRHHHYGTKNPKTTWK